LSSKATPTGISFRARPSKAAYSQGDTYEEAVENIKDAVRLHIEDRIADGEEIPQVSVSLSTVEIAV
jgi:predicted RNase H-like HicB family nuclease